MRQFKELQDNLFSSLWLLLVWLLVSPPLHPRHLDLVKQEQHEQATIADQTTAAKPLVAAYLTEPTINHRSDPRDYSESKETIWPTFTLLANKYLGSSPTIVSCGRICKAGGLYSHSTGWEYTLQPHSTKSFLFKFHVHAGVCHCQIQCTHLRLAISPSLLTKEWLCGSLLSFLPHALHSVNCHCQISPQIFRDPRKQCFIFTATGSEGMSYLVPFA